MGVRKMLHDDLKYAPPKEKRIVDYVIFILIFAVILISIFFQFDSFSSAVSRIWNAVLPFFTGLIFAFVLNTIVNLFQNHVFKGINEKCKDGKIWNKIRRPITLIIAYLFVIALICLIVFFIIPELVKSGKKLAVNAANDGPVYYNQLITWVTDTVNKLNINIDIDTIKETFFKNFSITKIIDDATSYTSNILSSVITATVNIASFVFVTVMSIIYSVYFLTGKNKLVKGWQKVVYAFIPQKWADRLTLFLKVCNSVFSSYVRGQLTECLILGTLCYIGMSIIGFDYALLISCILAVAALVPLIGIYIGALMGALILLMVHPIDALWFLIFIICLQQFEGNVIYPRVVGSSIGLPGIWTLTSVMVFGSLFGIPGIIFGVPTVAVFYRIIRYKANQRLEAKGITENVYMYNNMSKKHRNLIYPEIAFSSSQNETDHENKPPHVSALKEYFITKYNNHFNKAKH
jgi:predicted PurR-regulated permease PerM